MDHELFELCKEVYKRTKWVLGTSTGFSPDGARFAREGKQSIDELPNGTVCPVYNSDYLLEKLPKKTVHDSSRRADEDYWLIVTPATDGWIACYSLNVTGREIRMGTKADTPLKALLKLTIALDDAGELK